MSSIRKHREAGPRAARKLAVLALMTALVVALLPTTVLAASGPGSGGSGGGPGSGGPPDRDVDVDVEPYRARIRSMAQNDGDELGYEIESQNRLRIEMEYTAEGDGSQAQVRMTVTFREVIEYEDEDGDGLLGPGDEVVSTYDLDTAQYQQLQHQEQGTADGKHQHMFTVTTSDGVFAMISHMAETRTQTASGLLDPNWIKVDIAIEDFPYARTTTRLALRTEVQAEGPVTLVREGSHRAYMGEDESGIEVDQEGQVGFYTWMHSYSVDGKTKQVGAYTSTDGEATQLYFNYEQGDSIVHDPKLGVTLPEAGDAFDIIERLFPYVAALAVGAVVIGASISWRKRRNGRVA